MLITFALLGAAMAAVWGPPILWKVLFSAAVGAGLASGALTWPAVLVLMAMALVCMGASRSTEHRLGWIWPWAAGAWLLALALHRMPGFHNPTLLNAVRTSTDALSFSLHANFDKGSAGLFLLVFFAPRVQSFGELRAIAAPTLLGFMATAIVTFGVAVSMGGVRPDLKLPPFTAMFLAINLLFTCVAEEAFFRGLIQERLTRALAGRAGLLSLIPVMVSALLFGLAHAGSGGAFMALASLAGLGYALVYAHTRRVEAAVLTHFLVNTVHFLCFSYPALAGSGR